MDVGLEVIFVAGAATLGGFAGFRVATMGRLAWIGGYAVALGYFLLKAAAQFEHRLDFIPPLSWINHGWGPEWARAGLGAFLPATLIPRLPRTRDRTALAGLSLFMLLAVSIWPAAAPGLNRGTLAQLATEIDADGICRQRTTYTCGPAASVTALRRLGLDAHEGPLAIACRTTEATGTPPYRLAETLDRLYRQQGVQATFRHFPTSESLPRDGATIALMKFGLLLDHYVAILEATPARVVVGDPLLGRRELTPAEFDREWRHVGIVLQRRESTPPPGASRRLLSVT